MERSGAWGQGLSKTHDLTRPHALLQPVLVPLSYFSTVFVYFSVYLSKVFICQPGSSVRPITVRRFDKQLTFVMALSVQ